LESTNKALADKMNKMTRLIVILSLVFSSAFPVHASPLALASNPDSHQAVPSLNSESEQTLKNQSLGRYDPYDPTYFNSLRWLVYALILFLPFSPPQPPNPTTTIPGAQKGL
jgi:hypothetical protein